MPVCKEKSEKKTPVWGSDGGQGKCCLKTLVLSTCRDDFPGLKDSMGIYPFATSTANLPGSRPKEGYANSDEFVHHSIV